MTIGCKAMGKLLSYISEVSMTLRMNSSYCSYSLRNENTPRNVMWLSDMLHNLWGIGEAMQSQDSDLISEAIDKQISYWMQHHSEIEQARLDTIAGDWSVQGGIDILNEIKTDLESS